ncbi:hypothetical protein BaRGS_00031487 [Batillaria attramentaria]|uniref:Uncharacterized protein n=1 Tax=Batillaria attramentaria TaxID=370345 RepID=A0ABD0JRG8_9CAEN
MRQTGENDTKRGCSGVTSSCQLVTKSCFPSVSHARQTRVRCVTMGGERQQNGRLFEDGACMQTLASAQRGQLHVHSKTVSFQRGGARDVSGRLGGAFK